MVLFLPQYAVVIFNFVTFPSFVFLSLILIYLGRITSPEKRITLPWIFLSLGVFLMGVPYLLEIAVFFDKFTEVDVFAPSYISVLVGALLTFTSFTGLYLERVNEINSLKKEREELELRLDGLRKKLM